VIELTKLAAALQDAGLRTRALYYRATHTRFDIYLRYMASIDGRVRHRVKVERLVKVIKL
jgi:hypothetical protein